MESRNKIAAKWPRSRPATRDDLGVRGSVAPPASEAYGAFGAYMPCSPALVTACESSVCNG